MICGKTLKDIIKHEKIREMTGVDRLEERGPVKTLHLEVDRTKNEDRKRDKRSAGRLNAQDRET